MSSKNDVEKLDWESAVAAATLKLEPNSQTNNPQSLKTWESHLYRGIARCFIPDKEGKHKEAIEDLGKTIALGINRSKSYYYRAYAFFLDGDYEKAIADCRQIKSKNLFLHRDELLGKIYIAMSKYEEAVENLKNALGQYNNLLFPPCLLDCYREACKRMNSV